MKKTTKRNKVNNNIGYDKILRDLAREIENIEPNYDNILPSMLLEDIADKKDDNVIEINEDMILPSMLLEDIADKK
jgi:hypothetical protein